MENTSATMCVLYAFPDMVLLVLLALVFLVQLTDRYMDSLYYAANLMQVLGKITKDGVFLEKLERNPSKYLPEVNESALSSTVCLPILPIHNPKVVKIDLNQPMKSILAELTKLPVTTRVSLTGKLVVARDIAHAKLLERIERGEGLPEYFKNHPVYYAGPAKTPEGYASGSFGPTTAGTNHP